MRNWRVRKSVWSRGLSFFLALVMILGSVPGSAVTAFAEDLELTSGDFASDGEIDFAPDEADSSDDSSRLGWTLLDTVEIRQEADAGSEVVDSIQGIGSEVSVLDQIDTSDGTWYLVRYRENYP